MASRSSGSRSNSAVLFLSRYINCSTRIHNPTTGRYERYCIAPSYGGGCRRETQMWWGRGIESVAIDTFRINQ